MFNLECKEKQLLVIGKRMRLICELEKQEYNILKILHIYNFSPWEEFEKNEAIRPLVYTLGV